MVALFTKDSFDDPSKKAEAILDYVLKDPTEGPTAKNKLNSSVTEELKQAPVIQASKGRTLSRVLFITREVRVLQENSTQQLHYKNIADMFAEVHVVVLSEIGQAKKGVIRLGTNVWAYSTSARYFWAQPFAALSLARTQLCFVDGFRPDIIVAQDPFESGLSGLLLAQKYDREFQLHIDEDYFLPTFKTLEKNNTWRLHMASYVLRRSMSIRTTTNTIREKVIKKATHTKDISLLPRHYGMQALTKISELSTNQDPFPQFAFIILFVGILDHESTLFRAIDAARSILQSPSIGLVVLGDGPAKKEFQKRGAILGIAEQIIFKNDQRELTSYMKGADILLCTDTTESSDELVITAAALGLPILASETPLRKDLFKDGVDAFLCPKEETVCFSEKLVQFLNINALRTQFGANAKDVVKTRLEEDPEVFKTAYRDSIEGVFSSENQK